MVALVLTVLFLRFDSNPLDLRSPKVESVSTLFDLMKNPQTSPNTIDVPALSLAAADALAARISEHRRWWPRPSPCPASFPRTRTESWR